MTIWLTVRPFFFYPLTLSPLTLTLSLFKDEDNEVCSNESALRPFSSVEHRRVERKRDGESILVCFLVHVVHDSIICSFAFLAAFW